MDRNLRCEDATMHHDCRMNEKELWGESHTDGEGESDDEDGESDMAGEDDMRIGGDYVKDVSITINRDGKAQQTPQTKPPAPPNSSDSSAPPEGEDTDQPSLASRLAPAALVAASILGGGGLVGYGLSQSGDTINNQPAVNQPGGEDTDTRETIDVSGGTPRSALDADG